MKRFVIAALLIVGALLSRPAVAAPYYDSAGIWPVLGDGDDKPSVVRAAQYLLRAKGFYVVVDGCYGDQTKSAIAAFRAKRKLSRRDDVGDDTTLTDTQTWEGLVIELKRGSKGFAVRALQTLLRAKGYHVAVDGRFGPQTERAVRQFQEARDYTSVDPGDVEGFTWCDLVGEGAWKGGGG